MALIQWFLSVIKIPLNQTLVLASFLLLYLPFLLDKELAADLKRKISAWKRRLIKTEILSKLIFFVFLIFLAIIAIQVFSHTVWGADALTYWLFRARAYFIDGLITKENLFPLWAHEQPMLWSLTATLFYYFLGYSSEYFFQLVPLIIFSCIVWVFYVNLSRLPRWLRVLLTGILCLTPFLWQNVALAEYVGNADLLVSFYFLLAMVFILKENWLLTAFFLYFAFITKSDALPALTGFLFLGPLFILGFKLNKKGLFKAWGVVFLLLFVYWVWHQEMKVPNEYLYSLNSGIFKQRSIFSYIWYEIHAFREEFRQIYRWGLGWWLIFFLTLINLGRIAKRPSLFLAMTLILCQFLGYLLVYYITPENPASQIATSIFRLVLQLYPASLFLVSYLSYNKNQDANRD